MMSAPGPRHGPLLADDLLPPTSRRPVVRWAFPLTPAQFRNPTRCLTVLLVCALSL